jgi:DNA topoisomerase-2
MDDSIMDDDSIFNISDDDNSDFVPEKPAAVSPTHVARPGCQVTDFFALQKTKAKAAPKKAATKPAAKKAQTTLKGKGKTAAAKKKAKADSEDEMSDVHMSDDDADSLLSQTPPKAKKAAATKRAGSKPLADVENESFGGDATSETPKQKGGASEKYQKVSCARNGIIL